jgi:hypothetical protein
MEILVSSNRWSWSIAFSPFLRCTYSYTLVQFVTTGTRLAKILMPRIRWCACLKIDSESWFLIIGRCTSLWNVPEAQSQTSSWLQDDLCKRIGRLVTRPLSCEAVSVANQVIKLRGQGQPDRPSRNQYDPSIQILASCLEYIFSLSTA